MDTEIMDTEVRDFYDNLSVANKHALLSQLIKDYDIWNVYIQRCHLCDKVGYSEFPLNSEKYDYNKVRCQYWEGDFVECASCGKTICEDCLDKQDKHKREYDICPSCLNKMSI